MTAPNDTQLRLLLSRIQTLSDEYWHLLTSSRQAMDGHAWVGPSAKVFAAQLQRNDAALHAELRKALRLLREKQNRGPLL